MKFKLRTTEKPYYYQMRAWLNAWDHGLMTKEEVDNANKVRRMMGVTEYAHPSKRGTFKLTGFNEHHRSGPKKYHWKTPYIKFKNDKDAFWFALTMGEVIANENKNS